MTLPQGLDFRAFDSLHDDLPAWRAAIGSIALELGCAEGELQQISEGTVLVARLGTQRILKVYPPFLRDHFEFECAMLPALFGQLSVPTPHLLATGERDGWPWLLMTQLQGTALTTSWPLMAEAQRLVLLRELGALAAQVHRLPVGRVAALAPRWGDFIAAQRGGCVARQERTGLPAHLLQQVASFIDGPLPGGPDVLLSGEYTPFNLFTSDHRLCAMFDFGDGLVGPRQYDWLGPLCFLAAGHPARCEAFISGCGASLGTPMRLSLMRLLLLHRYSSLRMQLAYPGWERAASFEQLAAWLWG